MIIKMPNVLFSALICTTLVIAGAGTGWCQESGGPPMDCYGCEMHNEFMAAAEEGDLPTLERLLKEGITPNDINYSAFWPLMAAAEAGRTAAARLLIEAGAEVDAANIDGLTALMVAARNGRLEAVKLLVEKGAYVKAADNDGLSAGKMASDAGNVEVVAYLKKHGFDSGADKYIRMIREEHYKQFTGADFIKAVEENNRELVLLFIKAGINMAAPAKSPHFETTAMEEAIKAGHADMVKLMIENGLDVNSARRRGDPPLALAVRQGRNEIVKLLLKAGASVKRAKPRDEPVLFTAVSHQNLELTRLLLDAGAEMYAERNYCCMAQAVKDKSGAIVRLLLDKGYALDRCRDDAKIPSLLIDEPDREEAKLLLPRFGGDVYGPLLIRKLLQSDERAVSLIMQYKPDLHARADGITVLTSAAYAGNRMVVKACLDAGADVNAGDDRKAGALLHAAGSYGTTAEKDRLEIVRMLLDKGAQVNAGDDNGATPLMMAAANDRPKIALLLIERGADVNARAATGETALAIASARNLNGIAALLRKAGAK